MRLGISVEKYLTERGLIKQEMNLYHYTNVDALKKIMDSSTLLATHMQYMNDWSEYEQGYRKLVEKLKSIIKNSDIIPEGIGGDILNEKVMKLPSECPKTPQEYREFIVERNSTRMERLLPEVYAVSFCKQSNLLNQWLNYAKESGICIEFDFRDFEFICPDVTEEIYDLYGKDIIERVRVYDKCRPIQIVYDENTMLEVIENDIGSYLQRIFDKDKLQIDEEWWEEMGNVFSIVPFFKHSAFSPEEEVRLAVRPLNVPLDCVEPRLDKLSGMFKAKIHHMESNHILKPRIKIQWRKKVGADQRNGGTPIKSITVGPGANQQMTYQSIIHYIEYELEHIPTIQTIEQKRIELAEKIRTSTGNFKDTYATNKGIIVRKSVIPYIY